MLNAELQKPTDAQQGQAPAAVEQTKILVDNLNFYYGKFHALKNINLTIPEKRVTAFIGPSGCGKSTLLRVLNRMFELYPEQRAEGRGSDEGWRRVHQVPQLPRISPDIRRR